MKAPAYRYVFGPVASRRLGMSLGIDLVPMKTCTYDCVYCQLGPTRARTLERREWVPAADAIREFDDYLAQGGRADAVTLAGSGEPTLHTGFGDVLQAVRDRCGIPTVLLTNGSLFHRPEVREAAARAHCVKVTFSAPDDETWRAIHRPSPGLRFDDFVEGVRRFRREFSGQLWFEVMAVKGMNDAPEQVARLARTAKSLSPDLVQINTPVRPPSDETVRALSGDELARIASQFDPVAEVVGSVSARASNAETKGSLPPQERILALVSRHPASAREIAVTFGVSEKEIAPCIESLLRDNRLFARERDGRAYYSATPAPSGR